MNAYITGTSLICNIGDDYKQIIQNLKNMNKENYLSNLKKIFEQKAYYKIYNYDYSNEKRYKKIIKKVINNAIKEAGLSKEEQKDLYIFIGSTSMEMAVNEEYRKNYEKEESNLEFKAIGNGSIGEYLENLINSKHKSLLFATACTSSVNALCYASRLIKEKKIKRALVVGLELFNKSTYGGFSSLMLLSKKKIYRPFDKHSDGIILGEACSAIILDSKKRNENDFAYLSSSNICDNYSETTSDPSGIPIFEAMKESLEKASLQLNNIDCIKAHATGSENNNSSEANGIKQLFEYYNSHTKITSLKPIIGHTLGACGTNEIVLMLYAIRNNFLPANFGFEKAPDEFVFEPLKEHYPISKKQTILFNYVAFGGNNSSVILSNKV